MERALVVSRTIAQKLLINNTGPLLYRNVLAGEVRRDETTSRRRPFGVGGDALLRVRATSQKRVFKVQASTLLRPRASNPALEEWA